MLENDVIANIVLSSIISVLGTVGNTLVIIAFFSIPSLRTITNMFVLQLAIIDLMKASIILPTKVVNLAKGATGINAVHCQIIGVLRTIGSCQPAILFAMIATVRYFKVVKPLSFSNVFTYKKAALYSGCIVIAAATIGLLPVIGVGTYAFSQSHGVCFVNWSEENIAFRTIYYICNVGIAFPVVVVCYFKIFKTIRAHEMRVNRTLYNVDANKLERVIAHHSPAVKLDDIDTRASLQCNGKVDSGECSSGAGGSGENKDISNDKDGRVKLFTRIVTFEKVHGQDHKHGHKDGGRHEHEHGHVRVNECELRNGHEYEHGHKCGHGHGHENRFEDRSGHNDEYEYGHEHDENGHVHENGHEHEYVHAPEQKDGHEPVHGRKHGHGYKHEHEPEHQLEDGHGHGHGNKRGHKHGNTQEHDKSSLSPLKEPRALKHNSHSMEHEITIVMFAIVVVYALCWIPAFIVNILNLSKAVEIPKSALMFIVTLLDANVCLNPLIYGVGSKQFRTAYAAILHRRCGK